jgi:hypothetical protein
LAANQVQAPVAQAPTPQATNIAAIQGTPITGATAGTTSGLGALAANQTVANQTATVDTTAAAKTGVFQTVYDPKTGREFNSPAQALQFGVTDYVTSLPSSIALPPTAQNAVNAWLARPENKGKTANDALNSLGAQFGMTGDQFKNAEIQGSIGYGDQQVTRSAIGTESGGLTPEQLTAKLQAYKTKPPTTAQEFADQRALYADYQNRYANSSYNYANMGGKAQDHTLKPSDYLAVKFSGYAEPINAALSSMNQMSTDFKDMSKILQANPEINTVVDELYKINPKLQLFNTFSPTTVANLNNDIKRYGSTDAMRRLIDQQQNLLVTSPDAQGKLGNFNQTTMSNPEYRALNTIKDSYTPIVDSAAWNKRVTNETGRSSSVGAVYRDADTGKGLAIQNNQRGVPQEIRFINQQGQGINVPINDPAKLLSAFYESGMSPSAFTELSKTFGSEYLVPPPKDDEKQYFLPALQNGIKFSDFADGTAARVLASDSYLKDVQNRALADYQSSIKNDTPENAAANSLQRTVDSAVNDQKIAKAFVGGQGGTANAPAGLAALASNQTATTDTQTAPTGVAALAANQKAPYTQYTTDQIAQYLLKNPTADLTKAIKDTNADPAAVNRYIASLATSFKGSTDTAGGSGTLGIFNQLKAQGIDPVEYYNAAIASNPNYAGYTQPMIQKAYDLSKGAYALSDKLGGKVADTDWVKFMDDNKYSIDDAAQAFGLSRNEVQRRYNAVKAAEKKVDDDTIVKKDDTIVKKDDTIVKKDDTIVKKDDTGTKVITKDDGTKVTRVTEPTPITTAPDVTLPPGIGGNTGPSIIGGGSTVNPNGTITTSPRIPGIPVGGFTGMKSLRDAYTQGGGSLGYTPYTPKTAAEHATMYNTMTGDSAAAYKYLMGEGAYPTKSGVGEIAKPYRESVMGYPASTNKAYNYVNGQYVRNPDYVAPMRDSSGNVTYGMSLNEIKSTLAKAPLSGQALYDWAMQNEVTAQDIADATGMKLSEVYAQLRIGQQAATAKAAADKAATAKTTEDTTSTQQISDGLAMGGLAYADGGITGTGQLNLNIPLNLGGSGGGANGYSAMGGGFGSSGGYQGQGSQNSVQQSGMPDFRNQMQGFESQMQKLPSIMAYNDYGKSISGRPPTADEYAKMQDLQKAIQGDKGYLDLQSQMLGVQNKYQQQAMRSQSSGLQQRYMQQGLQNQSAFANGGMSYAVGGGLGSLGSYSDGGRLLRGPGDGVSDSIPATIGRKQQPARLADGEFVIPARIVSELGNGSTEAGAKKLYAMMDRVQRARGKTTGKNKVAANSRADKYLPA